MQHINQQISEEEVECLPSMAWLFMAVAIVPHLLAQVGSGIYSQLAGLICFPACMGPFSIAHAYIIGHSLGFTTHMAWISALLFSLVWFATMCGTWRRSRNVAMAIGLCSFLFSVRLLWVMLAPLG